MANFFFMNFSMPASHIPHRIDECFGAMRIIAIHVKTGASRRKQHGIARAGELCCLRHRIIHVHGVAQRNIAALQRGFYQRRIAPDQHHGACMLFDDSVQWGKILFLTHAPRDQHRLATQAFQCGNRRTDVSPLGVIVISDPMQAGNAFHAMRQAFKVAQRAQQDRHG